MSSVERGDRFEDLVHTFFDNEIREEKFFAKPACCRLYRKKKYYSAARGGDIEFDLAIEVTLPEADAPSVFVLIECKDYQDPVPVSDVEEFESKVLQVTGLNAKAIFVTSSALQSGAFHFCRVRGIGLVRFFDASEFKWELRRTPSSFGFAPFVDNSHEAMTSSSPQSRSLPYVACLGHSCTPSLGDYLGTLLNRALGWTMPARSTPTLPGEEPSIVRFVPAKEIADCASRVRGSINAERGDLDLEATCQAHGIEIKREGPGRLGPGVLGRITFEPPVITLYNYSPAHPIGRFTLSHELGHLFLGHGSYLRAEYCDTTDIDDLEASRRIGISSRDVRMMEWQANHFAACLLLPDVPFLAAVAAFAKACDVRDRGFGLFYLDHQGCNRGTYNAATEYLAREFGVSSAVAGIRLKHFNLVTDARRSPTRLMSLR